MPLTRYEIRNECSLANPDLYRAAAKDDPEGLLEGVAMAGLVGIVRQLGDLAEFAAEVFHDLHEEVLATAERGHELLIRVQQLETELPVVEKMMFAGINYVNFAYNPGMEWHASICNDQNHFTQGDLPRFVRIAYEDCRGPPRLSELDKFDVAGAGACLKRYTDPSFFKMEWASSELMKAEKEKQERKARRIKKKSRGHMREAIFTTHVQPRLGHTPLEAEDLGSTSRQFPLLKSHHDSEQKDLGPVHEQALSARLMIPEDEVFEHKKGSLRVPLSAEERSDLKASMKSPLQDRKPLEVTIEPSDFNHEPSKYASDRTEVMSIARSSDDMAAHKEVLCMGVTASEDLADKVASEADNFTDALTTMDSEVETDVDIKTVFEVNREFGSDAREEDTSLQVGEMEFNYLKNAGEEGLVTEYDIPSDCEKPEFSGRVDLVQVGSSARTSPSVKKQLDGSYPSPSAEESGAYTLINESEKKQPICVDGSYPFPSPQERSASTPINKSATPSPALAPSVAVNSGDSMESESFEEVPGTPETRQAKDTDDFRLEDLESAFHQIPEMAMPLANESPQDGIPDNLGLLSPLAGAKSSMLLNKWPSAEENNLEDSESEPGEGLREPSPHSSANSSIQPISWARDFSSPPSNLLDSDDELNGMQVSSSCPSSNSSALSSPRPFALATTVSNMDFDKEPQSILSPHGSIKSSSESLLGNPLQYVENASQSAWISIPPTVPPLMSPAMASVMSPPPVNTSSNLTMSPPPSNTSSNLTMSSQLSASDMLPALELKCQVSSATEQNQGLEPDEFEPPPPPLPPVEWRMTRRPNAIPPVPNSFLKSPFDQSGVSTTSAQRSFTPQSIFMQPNKSIQSLQSYPTVDHDCDMPLSQLQQSVGAPSATHRESLIFENISKDVKPLPREPLERPVTAKTPDELMQPSEAYRLGFPTQPRFPVIDDDLVESSEPYIRHSKSQVLPVKANEPPQTFTDAGENAYEDDEVESYHAAANADEDDEEESSYPGLSQLNSHLQEQSVASSPLESGGHNPSASVSNKIPADGKDEVWDDHLSSPPTRPNTPLLLEEKEEEKESILSGYTRSIPSPPLEPDSIQLSRPFSSKSGRRDPLIAAIASHDRSTLKTVPELSQSSRTVHSDDREVLLEQIRTRSFSLRHTEIEKQVPPRPIASINVAAILEKANAIRQAFAGSDDDEEDDDWSD